MNFDIQFKLFSLILYKSIKWIQRYYTMFRKSGTKYRSTIVIAIAFKVQMASLISNLVKGSLKIGEHI